jgi:hypothetical protein
MTDDKSAAVRLREAPTDTRVRLHYFSAAQGGRKTKTGVKTGSGGPLEAATVDTLTEFSDGTPRILQVQNSGTVKVKGPKATQRIGTLQAVDLPEDADDETVSLEDGDEVDWLKEGREAGEQA